MIKKFYIIILLIVLSFGCSDNSGDKFIGTWKNPKWQGKNSQEITISKNGENYLVEFKSKMDADFGFVDRSGSFKETGKLENGFIVISPMIKLSLIQNNTKLLMNNDEFINSNSPQLEVLNPQTRTDVKALADQTDEMLGIWIPDNGNPKNQTLTITSSPDGYNVKDFQENLTDETYEGLSDPGAIFFDFKTHDGKKHETKLFMKGNKLIRKSTFGEIAYIKK